MAVTKERKAEYDRERYIRNRANPDWVAREKARLAALPEETKRQRSEYGKAYRAAHKDRYDAYMKARRATGYFEMKRREYAARDPEGWRKRQHGIRIKARYGITREQYLAMYEAQGGACAICKKPESAIVKGVVAMLSVDHDRKCCPGRKSCGQCVRALLCGRCNAALGQVNDSPDLLRAMIAYLE